MTNERATQALPARPALIFDRDRIVNLIGVLVFSAVVVLVIVAASAQGGDAVVVDDYVCFDQEEAKRIVEMRDVTIPMLQAEVWAKTLEGDACAMELKYARRPMRQPAVNFTAGLGTCVLSGAAMGWAAGR